MSATRRTRWTVLALLAAVWPLLSCSSKPDPNTLVMIIESSPTNLDPRVGLDAQSERIDELIFDDLLDRDEHLNVKPALADSWEIPDPKTYVFHLHHGVKFHDGRPLTARDVKWTFDSILQGKIRTTKSAVYRPVDHIDTPDDYTVVFHLKEPFATLLWNLSDGAIGIVPYGSGEEVSQHPIGSGPFRFVSAEQDKEVIIERNDDYWGEKAKLPRVRFAVVPDPTTRALEMRKGSADVLSNALGFDTVVALQRETSLVILRGPGTILSYMAFNLRDPILKDVRVRQAIAYAINRPPILKYLVRGFERPAYSVLPPESWAYDGNVPHYDYDPAKARALARSGGLPVGERRALSSDHEDLDRREHEDSGGRPATTNERGRHRARHSHLRVRHFLRRRHPRRVPALFIALDRRQRRSRHLRIRLPLRQVHAARRQPRLLLQSEGGCAYQPGAQRT